MVEENLKFRPLAADSDWPVIIPWMHRKGWIFENENLFTSTLQMKHCRFMVAVGNDNVPLSCLAYSVFDSYIYLDHYITDPECRGNGIGFKLWNWVIDKVGRHKTYYLVSVEPMTEKYRTRCGFEYISPITCLRYTGFVNVEKLGQIISDDKTFDRTALKIVSTFNDFTIQRVIEYDSRIRSCSGSAFLEIWLKQDLPENVRTVCVKDGNDCLKGYGSIVKGNGCRRLGPLVADNFSIMLNMVEDLLGYDFSNDKNKDCQNLQWNVPSSNRLVIDLLEKLEFGKNCIVLDRSFTRVLDNDCFSEKIFCLALQLGQPN